MGLSGISPMSLLLILLICVMLFGTKRLRNIGEDLGHAVRSFRKAMNGSEASSQQDTPEANLSSLEDKQDK